MSSVWKEGHTKVAAHGAGRIICWPSGHIGWRAAAGRYDGEDVASIVGKHNSIVRAPCSADGYRHFAEVYRVAPGDAAFL